ncbi:hypothetical protein ABK040_004897 [Willaertia magna]
MISLMIFLSIPFFFWVYYRYYAKEHSLQGLNALVTGGARGLGKEVVDILIKKENVNKVVIWDIDEKSLNECKEQYGDKVIVKKIDITDRQEVYNERDRLQSEENIYIDILINNAGIVNGKTLLETDDDKIEQVYKVNTISHSFLVKAFLPEMIKKNNDNQYIVTVASAAAISGTASLTDYSSSKYAAFGFHEALRLEIKKKKYKVNTVVVCPYYIQTDLFKGIKDTIPYLLPVLKPDYVANRMVEGIKKREELILIPELILRTVYLLRFLLPVSMFDKIMVLMGVVNSMDSFKGRN